MVEPEPGPVSGRRELNGGLKSEDDNADGTAQPAVRPDEVHREPVLHGRVNHRPCTRRTLECWTVAGQIGTFLATLLLFLATWSTWQATKEAAQAAAKSTQIAMTVARTASRPIVSVSLAPPWPRLRMEHNEISRRETAKLHFYLHNNDNQEIWPRFATPLVTRSDSSVASLIGDSLRLPPWLSSSIMPHDSLREYRWLEGSMPDTSSGMYVHIFGTLNTAAQAATHYYEYVYSAYWEADDSVLFLHFPVRTHVGFVDGDSVVLTLW